MLKCSTVTFAVTLVAGATLLPAQVAPRINGIVNDNTGAAMPRTSVVLEAPGCAVIERNDSEA
jgi:hypothetical protein